jgi:outer membrane protein OmpA-like peptidoglycan-associated protein
MALFSVVSVSAFGASVKGMIITRTGETLIVKSDQGNVTVVLTDDTKTKDDTGVFGLGTNTMSSVVLIPGLKVEVDGTSDDHGRFVAKTITVDGDDLEANEMIQAGLHPTAQQVAANVEAIAANKQSLSANTQDISANEQNISANRDQIDALKGQAAAHKEITAAHQQKIEANIKGIEENSNRFSALADYDVKAEATVKFETGRSSISAEDQEELKTLAETATALKGYIIEVTGYADSTGSAAINTKLSEARAKAVITFLMQQGGVPVRHIIAPGAMGEYGPAASNETEGGRAENRRVEVKVLVNKGIDGF